MNKCKTQYRKSWEDDNLYTNFSKWVRNIANKSTFAGCSPSSIIDLSNMGLQALKSRSKSTKHPKASALVASSTPITFFQKQSTQTN